MAVSVQISLKDNMMDETTTAVAEAPKKRAAKATKKTVAKKVPVKASTRQGRTSAYAGKKIEKLVTIKGTEVTSMKSGKPVGRMRDSGDVRECWEAIKSGGTVETYRSNAPNSGLARKVLADFIKKGYVKLV